MYPTPTMPTTNAKRTATVVQNLLDFGLFDFAGGSSVRSSLTMVDMVFPFLVCCSVEGMGRRYAKRSVPSPAPRLIEFSVARRMPLPEEPIHLARWKGQPSGFLPQAMEALIHPGLVNSERESAYGWRMNVWHAVGHIRRCVRDRNMLR